MRTICLPLLVVIACSDPGEVRVPRSTATLVGEIDLTIGAPDETREPFLFGRISGVALHPDGRILVSDQSAANVRVFSTGGEFLYAFGQRGSGPGDLNWPCCLAFSPDGTLWVREIGNRRFSLFTIGEGEATFVRSQRFVIPNPRPLVDRTAWDENGRAVEVGHLETGLLRALVDAAGTIARSDTVHAAPAESLAVMEVSVPTPGAVGGGAVYYHEQPYGPVELRAFGPGGEVATAVSSRYSVSWFGSGMARVALLQRNLDAPVLSERERQEADSTLDDIAGQRKASRASLEFGVPERKPILRMLGFDLDGRLWVERNTPEAQPREADVYDRDGRLIAIMRWPAHVSLAQREVSGDTGLGIATDSDGVQTVVRLRFR